MNSKAKGEISEARIVAALVELGDSVSIPFGDNQRYDLIWDRRGVLYRVQIKTARLVDGVVRFNTASVNGFTGERSGYDGQIDLFLGFLPDNGKIYVVPVREAPKTDAKLRVEAMTRRQKTSRVKWASDYE